MNRKGENKTGYRKTSRKKRRENKIGSRKEQEEQK